MSRWSLLAQGRVNALGRSFRTGNHGVDVFDVLFFMVGLLALVGLSVVCVKLCGRRSAVTNHPLRLFRELCRVHCLGRRQTVLLLQLARQHDLNHPARIFLEPSWFLETADEADVTELRLHLFGRRTEEKLSMSAPD